ncbi:bifunctional precorrin-2 dehydrogenase/sirohydrochlorin ferrochelatase [uncultured Dialister sp.]|uniref:precorrin-2 dehydrogenase/sirohydrochlorin ferrochelatase family protein n=1 Tax=uncultured Dialister sp. TaxID=278064 RepID=UPI0025CBCBD6|nr:bifunctional precorrin-2 dehydrogenase/sirohydrochlorin ferrochelatase [uncultured Dialister sp.]
MYPVNIKIRDMSCLVIGGGHIALRKVNKLLQEGAAVTVLAPVLSEELMELYRKNCIHWKQTFYQPGDTEGYHFVVTACGIRDVAEQVRKESLRNFFLYNGADFPSLGNCSLSACFEKGGIGFAISTNGRSPAMAKYIKTWLEDEIPSSFGAWLDRVSVIREELPDELSSSRVRECFWHSVFSDQVMNLVLSGNLDEAEECVRHAIGRFRTES